MDAPTTVVDAPLPSAQVAALSPEAKAHWRLTGEIDPAAKGGPAGAWPVAEPADRLMPDVREDTPSSTESDSSPDAHAERAPETSGRDKAASEPAAPKKRPNAETRIKELLAETERLKAENARLTATPKPTVDAAPAADVKPAPSPGATDTIAAFIDHPDLSKPVLTDVEFFTKFPKATSTELIAYVNEYKNQQRDAQRAHTDRLNTLQAAYREHTAAAFEADPDLWAKVPEDLRTAKTTGVSIDSTDPKRTAMNDISREVYLSEHAGRFLQYFAEHKEDLARIAALPDERSVMKAMAKLEASFDEPVTPRPAVRPRTVTAAPDPSATTLGSRTEGVVNDADAAVKSRDMGRYKAIMNAKDRVRFGQERAS